ncbi:MAG: helix-turn-helix transcriptional regulator [Ideonella sp.]|nr:helix-turn-helix transcriptional regulator [Ideonella sp.]MCC7458504.1 helix-turn-helix transcriptional regulator [Nitrospira sp.]
MPAERSPATVNRTLFDSELLQIGYIEIRPRSSALGPWEAAARNVLALPLTGVFAQHEGSGRQAVVTPSHALLLSAGRPYRLSFPGAIGDRCLALRFTPEALARLAPQALAAEGFDDRAFAQHLLLPPALMLARSRLWQRLAAGAVDPLEAEDHGVALLQATLGAARRPSRTGRPVRTARTAARRRRHVHDTLEAIAARPEHPWRLTELAALACMSPGHLAHVFRAEIGTTVYGYVLRARLAHALDAVLDSRRGLTEVALDAGFASHSHFTAKFRALFGCTPQALRQRGVRAATVHQLRTIMTAPQPLAA